MSAAAQTAPADAVPRRKRSLNAYEQEHLQVCLHQGYFLQPVEMLLEASLAMTLTQIRLYLAIVHQTYGRKTESEKQKYVGFSKNAAAELARCTPTGAELALSGLVEMGALLVSKRGRANYYAINYRMIGKFKPLEPRTIEMKPEPAPEPATQPRPVMIVFGSSAKPRPLAEVCQCHHQERCELGVHLAEERTHGESQHSQSLADGNGQLELADSSPSPPSTLAVITAFLEPFMAEHAVVLRTKTAKKIASMLDRANCPCDTFRARVLRRKGQIRSDGLLVALAEDAIKLHRQARRHAPAAPPAGPKLSDKLRAFRERAAAVAAQLTERGFVEVARGVEALPADVTAVERLMRLDDSLIASAVQQVDRSALSDIESDVSDELETLRHKFPRAELDHRRGVMIAARIRARLELPDLADLASHLLH